MIRLAAYLVISLSLWAGETRACNVPLTTLINETVRHSDYKPLPFMQYFPLTITEMRHEDFNGRIGRFTYPTENAMYDNREIVLHKERHARMSETQSCAIYVHEICHHFQNIHGKDMTREQRETECDAVQENYLKHTNEIDWAKPNNHNKQSGYEAVRDFKNTQRARASSDETDFDISKFDRRFSLGYGDRFFCVRRKD